MNILDSLFVTGKGPAPALSEKVQDQAAAAEEKKDLAPGTNQMTPKVETALAAVLEGTRQAAALLGVNSQKDVPQAISPAPLQVAAQVPEPAPSIDSPSRFT